MMMMMSWDCWVSSGLHFLTKVPRMVNFGLLYLHHNLRNHWSVSHLPLQQCHLLTCKLKITKSTLLCDYCNLLHLADVQHQVLDSQTTGSDDEVSGTGERLISLLFSCCYCDQDHGITDHGVSGQWSQVSTLTPSLSHNTVFTFSSSSKHYQYHRLHTSLITANPFNGLCPKKKATSENISISEVIRIS